MMSKTSPLSTTWDKTQSTQSDTTQDSNTNSQTSKLFDNNLYLYAISHDLRSPLASAISLIELAQLEEDPITKAYYLDLIATNLKKLNNYTEDVLSLIGTKSTSFVAEQINFKELCNQALSKHNLHSNFNKVQKFVSVQQDNDFFSDKRRLAIVLNNLCSNAFTYCNLNQVAPSISLKVSTTAKEARISFRDNGIGMTPTELKLLFKPFEKVSSNSKGTGLGLYIVQQMIEMLGGTIEVTSVKDSWTQFELVIPSQVQI